MRIRACVALLAAVVLVLTSCSREAGPTPKGQSDDPGPAALAVKVRALQTDDCYRAPTELAATSCQKYVTQLSNVPGTARKYARGFPALAEASDNLDSGVRAYHDNHCDSGGDADLCAAALTDMASALDRVQRELASHPG